MSEKDYLTGSNENQKYWNTDVPSYRMDTYKNRVHTNHKKMKYGGATNKYKKMKYGGYKKLRKTYKKMKKMGGQNSQKMKYKKNKSMKKYKKKSYY